MSLLKNRASTFSTTCRWTGDPAPLRPDAACDVTAPERAGFLHRALLGPDGPPRWDYLLLWRRVLASPWRRREEEEETLVVFGVGGVRWRSAFFRLIELAGCIFPVFSLTASSDMLLDLSDILQVSHSHLLPDKNPGVGLLP